MTLPSTRHDAPVALAPFPSPRWWVSDRDGNVALVAWPNPALAVWLATVVVGWTGILGSRDAATVTGVGHGALIVWALDEVVRGSSPVRRLLGAVVLVAQLVSLFG